MTTQGIPLIQFLGIPDMEAQLAKRGPGGARPGAGRPRDPDAMVKRLYVIRQDQAAWLESLASAGASMSWLVRTALDEYRARVEAILP
jgi:hypothetical protein